MNIKINIRWLSLKDWANSATLSLYNNNINPEQNVSNYYRECLAPRNVAGFDNCFASSQGASECLPLSSSALKARFEGKLNLVQKKCCDANI